MKKAIIVLILALSVTGFCCGKSAAQKHNEADPAMRIISPSFKNNEKIPVKFTYDGEDVNPALEIENLPDGTKSLALIVDDPDAPAGTFVHWVLYDIPPSGRIEEDSVPGKQGINDSGAKDYSGPYPPSGTTHRYYFKIYALDKVLDLNEGITKADLEKAMRGSILSSAELVGLYARNKEKR
jgi:Raf kinase inhibitor-like YbhB/YbcL family protein